jgi:hypothetical protein
VTYSRIGATEVDTSLTGRRVVAVLNLLVATRGKPQGIRIENGPEFISQVLDSWAFERGVGCISSGPESPLGTPMPRASTRKSECPSSRPNTVQRPGG